MSTFLSRRGAILLVVVATVSMFSVVWFVAGSRIDRPPLNRPEQNPAQPAQHETLPAADDAATTPLDFARDVVTALHGYDTRSSRDRWRRALLLALGTPEGSLGGQDIDRLIPDDSQWAQMAAVGQRASAMIDSAYVPALWAETAAQHPELPNGAVGVTVTGTQAVRWEGGASRVPIAITVLLLCPPATERCVVNRIPAQVAR